jgi:hypothetical protein
MRVLLAAACWVAIVGGVAVFQASRAARGPARKYAAHTAAGIFAVEVVASFDSVPDPFALTAGGQKAAAIAVRVNGVEALRKVDGVRAGEALRAEPVPGVVVGRNELFLEANPPQDLISRTHALRVRVLRDGRPVAERTFWTDPGTPLAAAFPLDVPAATGPEEDRHDH